MLHCNVEHYTDNKNKVIPYTLVNFQEINKWLKKDTKKKSVQDARVCIRKPRDAWNPVHARNRSGDITTLSLWWPLGQVNEVGGEHIVCLFCTSSCGIWLFTVHACVYSNTCAYPCILLWYWSLRSLACIHQGRKQSETALHKTFMSQSSSPFTKNAPLAHKTKAISAYRRRSPSHYSAATPDGSRRAGGSTATRLCPLLICSPVSSWKGRLCLWGAGRGLAGRAQMETTSDVRRCC